MRIALNSYAWWPTFNPAKVVAEKIDRISRLPLPEAERLVAAIRAKGARLAVLGIVDLSELVADSAGLARIVIEAVCRTCCCAWPCKRRATITRPAASASGRH